MLILRFHTYSQTVNLHVIFPMALSNFLQLTNIHIVQILYYILYPIVAGFQAYTKK